MEGGGSLQSIERVVRRLEADGAGINVVERRRLNAHVVHPNVPMHRCHGPVRGARLSKILYRRRERAEEARNSTPNVPRVATSARRSAACL
jgi:hypothetical protein